MKKKSLAILVSFALLLLVFSFASSTASAVSMIDLSGVGFVAHWNVNGVSIVVVISVFTDNGVAPWIYIKAGNTAVKQEFNYGTIQNMLPSRLYVQTMLPFAFGNGNIAMHSLDISYVQTQIPDQTDDQSVLVGVGGGASVMISHGGWVFGLANLIIDGWSNPRPTNTITYDAFAFYDHVSPASIIVP